MTEGSSPKVQPPLTPLQKVGYGASLVVGLVVVAYG